MSRFGDLAVLILGAEILIGFIGVGIHVARARNRLLGLVQGNTPIDHPSPFWRIFHRLSIFALCDFVSLITTPLMVRWAIPESVFAKIRNDALLQAIAVAYPLPLAVVLYVLSTKYLRHVERVRRQERMTIGEIARQKAQEFES